MLEFAEGPTTAAAIKTLCERNNFKKLHLQEVSAGYAAADVFDNSPDLESFYGVLQRGDYPFPKTLKVRPRNDTLTLKAHTSHGKKFWPYF